MGAVRELSGHHPPAGACGGAGGQRHRAFGGGAGGSALPGAPGGRERGGRYRSLRRDRPAKKRRLAVVALCGADRRVPDRGDGGLHCERISFHMVGGSAEMPGLRLGGVLPVAAHGEAGAERAGYRLYWGVPVPPVPGAVGNESSLYRHCIRGLRLGGVLDLAALAGRLEEADIPGGSVGHSAPYRHQCDGPVGRRGKAAPCGGPHPGSGRAVSRSGLGPGAEAAIE